MATRKVFTNAISYHGGETRRIGSGDNVENTCHGGGVVQDHAAAVTHHYPGAVSYIAKFAEEFLIHFDDEMSKLRKLLLYKKRSQVRMMISLTFRYLTKLCLIQYVQCSYDSRFRVTAASSIDSVAKRERGYIYSGY